MGCRPIVRAAYALLLLVLLVVAPGVSLAADPVERSASFVVRESPGGASRFDDLIAVEPASSVGASYNRLRQALDARHNAGTPLEVILAASVTPRELKVEAAWRATDDVPPLRFFGVVFTDGSERFHEVARQEVAAGDGSDGSLTSSFTLVRDPAWSQEGLGVVVFAQANASRGRYQEGEILQSAVWLHGQTGPTVQRGKAVFVEHATDAACAACRASEEAFLLLVTQNGFPIHAGEPSGSYLVAPSALSFVGLAVGALVAVMLVRRRE